jgi:hypothetical protein
MRALVLALSMVAPAAAWGKVVGVELEFTPFTGDQQTAEQVETVPGTATVWVNGIVLAEQRIGKQEVPVLFDDHEVAAAVWITADSLGGLARKGKNVVRIEFVPAAAETRYRTQLRWASVTDGVATQDAAGTHRATNMAGQGMETADVHGTTAVEHELQLDFVTDRPWHHYPAVTALSDDDRARIVALLAERAGWFRPDFAGAYRVLAGDPQVDVARVRRAQCLEAAWKAGVRVRPPDPATLELATTGSAAVMVRGRGETLYDVDRGDLGTIRDEAMQMCAGVTLSHLYPARLVVVRTPDGAWEMLP